MGRLVGRVEAQVASVAADLSTYGIDHAAELAGEGITHGGGGDRESVQPHQNLEHVGVLTVFPPSQQGE